VRGITQISRNTFELIAIALPRQSVILIIIMLTRSVSAFLFYLGVTELTSQICISHAERPLSPAPLLTAAVSSVLKSPKKSPCAG
jgi:hypothetical protein